MGVKTSKQFAKPFEQAPRPALHLYELLIRENGEHQLYRIAITTSGERGHETTKTTKTRLLPLNGINSEYKCTKRQFRKATDTEALEEAELIVAAFKQVHKIG